MIDRDIRVVNDVYIAGNVCTTNAKTVKSLKEFKEKLTSAIEKSKKLTVHLRKMTINMDFEKDDE
jgi:aromatic ring-opening dioxygenase LigB subunit